MYSVSLPIYYIVCRLTSVVHTGHEHLSAVRCTRLPCASFEAYPGAVPKLYNSVHTGHEHYALCIVHYIEVMHKFTLCII